MTRSVETFSWRRNGVTVVALALCFYFTYHIIQGERSVGRLIGLQAAMARDTAELETLKTERAELESRVTQLRPGSLNRDYVEERARAILGLRAAGEMDVIPPAASRNQ